MASLSPPLSSSRAPCRVIVADDNHDAADSLALLISTLGYAAQAVYDGDEAVVAWRADSPELLICDVQMPVADGLQAARRIRACAHGDEIALVALTALASERDRRDTRDAGFDRHYVKPIGLAELKTLLQACLGASGSGEPGRASA